MESETSVAEPTVGAAASTTPGESQTSMPQQSREADCPRGGSSLLSDGPSVRAEELGERNGLEVKGAIYPHPEYEGNPWSQWGRGVALEDGRFFSAIGDHRAPDGNSYFFEFDPQTARLTLIGDVLSNVPHAATDWGYGKVHAPMVVGPCQDIYASTYWGSRRNLRFSSTYRGDVLLRLDPDTGTLENMGTLLEYHGVKSLAAWTEGNLLYGEAVDPNEEGDQGPFFVYDLDQQQVVFRTGEDAPHAGFLSILVDMSGRAYFSGGDGHLYVYDPARREVHLHPARIPGSWLTAATPPAPDGTVYGATRKPDTIFALHANGSIRKLADATGYVASLGLHPSGDRLFFIPGAHGNSWESGTPVMSLDTDSGQQEVLVELNPLGEEHLGLRLGGTYSLVVGPAGDRIYIGLNAGSAEEESSFGEIVLVTVQLR